MAKKFYTILVLPDATARARRFHITKAVARTAGVLLGLVLFTLAFFVYQYIGMNLHLLELRRLRQEARDQTALLQRVDQLEREIGRLRDLDWKLRTAVGLRPEKIADEVRGVGGGDPLDSTLLLDTLKSERSWLVEQLGQDLRALSQEVSTRERSFKELKGYLERQRSLLASTPTIWPVHGWITSTFGYRRSPFTGVREMHEGIDIAAPVGTPIGAAADGVVSFSGPLAGRGNVVLIEHGHGFTTFYGHTSRNVVREGQRVRRGDIVAYVGNTGRSTGPHVHFEVQVNGTAVNPMKYIVEEPLPFLGASREAEGAAAPPTSKRRS